MAIKHLIDAFDAARDSGRPLVLATVVATEGSTYSEPGTHMLIDPAGDYEGLISGGCLEGDLAEHAAAVMQSGVAKEVSYDMRDEAEDRLWGLGIGCNGAMSLLLQPLLPEQHFEPFASLSGLTKRRERGVYALVVASVSPALPIGSAVVHGEHDVIFGSGAAQALTPLCLGVIGDGRQRMEQLAVAGSSVSVFAAPVPRIPRLLVLGGGPDAVPLMRLADMLGWELSVIDHRQAYVERLAAAVGGEVREARPEALGSVVELDAFDACVVMSHHLETDIAYLRSLAASTIPFIGLLGPERRRQRMLEELGAQAGAIEPRAFGPVGLDIGADTPESIALSIVSQVQAILGGRDGGHLARRGL